MIKTRPRRWKSVKLYGDMYYDFPNGEYDRYICLELYLAHKMSTNMRNAETWAAWYHREYGHPVKPSEKVLL